MRPVDKLTEKVIGLAMKVHSALGPGLLESAYESCLCYELTKNQIEHRPQTKLPIVYDGPKLEAAYRLDVLIPDMLIVECKAVETTQPIHKQQLTSYSKALKHQCWTADLLQCSSLERRYHSGR